MDRCGVGTCRLARLMPLRFLYRVAVRAAAPAALGHGRYDEVYEEREFFELCKKSNRVVVHFGRSATRVRAGVMAATARAGV